MLTPELAIGIRRVKGVKRLGRRIGNWLSGDQAQILLNSIPQSTLRGRRDAALIGLLGCGLRRSEAVALRLDQIQLRGGHWVIADLFGKGGRLRTVPVPDWCKALMDSWLRSSGVTEGLVFRRIRKIGIADACLDARLFYPPPRAADQIGSRQFFANLATGFSGHSQGCGLPYRFLPTKSLNSGFLWM
jgi:integrase